MKSSTQLRRQLLISIGLSDKEAILYETLLKYGSLPAATLEKLSGLKKNTYTLLKNLERRSLVHKYIEEGRSHYQVGSPEQLKSYLGEKQREVKEATDLFTESLPSLVADYKKVVSSPVVSHYQGISGLRSVLEEVYANNKKVILGCFGNEQPSKDLYDEIINKYKPKRIENGILARAISPDSSRARALLKTAKEDLKEKYLVDPIKYPMPAELETWNDSFAMLSFKNDDFQGVIVKHPELALTIQSLLKLAMDLLVSQGVSYSSRRSNQIVAED